MTPTEFEYCQRALKALEEPMSLWDRIKIQRTMSQILERSAQKMEEDFGQRVEVELYGDVASVPQRQSQG